MELKLIKTKQNIYVGLIEGMPIVKTYWNGGVDSSLYFILEDIDVFTVVSKKDNDYIFTDFMEVNGEFKEINNDLFDILVEKNYNK